MKKFRFTLQALFTVHQQREQAALEVYARMLTEREEASKKLADAERQCQEAWEVNRQLMKAGAPARPTREVHAQRPAGLRIAPPAPPRLCLRRQARVPRIH